MGGIVSRAGKGVRESARGEQGGRCLRGNSPYGPVSGTQYACIKPHRLDSFVTVAMPSEIRTQAPEERSDPAISFAHCSADSRVVRLYSI